MKTSLNSALLATALFSVSNVSAVEIRTMSNFENDSSSKNNYDLCLDYVGATRNNDDLSAIGCIIDKPSQEWYFNRIGSTGYYSIENGEGGCLDDLYGSKYVGVWSACHYKSNQKWSFVEKPRGDFMAYSLVSGEGNCLDLGTNGKLYAWKCHGKPNQVWLISDNFNPVNPF